MSGELDYSGYSRFECAIGLFRHEIAADDFASWPAAVQIVAQRELDAFHARNPGIAVACMMTRVVRNSCELILLHPPRVTVNGTGAAVGSAPLSSTTSPPSDLAAAPSAGAAALSSGDQRRAACSECG